MKRPGLNLKGNWLSMAGVLFLMLALVMGVASSAKAATGSLDREKYLPSVDDASDYDRVWFSVTDSSGNTTNSQDTITVTVKAGANSASFILKETGGTTTVFTTSGLTQPAIYPVGTTSGYVEDFSGSHNYPALGTSIYGLNLKELSANTGGNADTGSGELTVEAGNTLELLYGGSTLDTAVVGFSSGSFAFTPSAVTAVTSDALSSDNLIISITDPDENLNPVLKDVIGFADGFVSLSGSPGTGSSRVQIEAIDQTSATGARLSVGGTEIVARSLVLVETGQNTGVFAASGKVFGSTTVASSSLHGNILVGSDTESYYGGSSITLGDLTTGPGVTFKILEVSGSGRVGLVEIGTTTTGPVEQALVYVSPAATLTGAWGSGTQSASLSNVAAIGTNSVRFGISSTLTGSSTTGIIKLIEGSDYCLVAISAFQGTTTADRALGATYENGNGGSVTVSLGSFQLAGPRDGDTIKVSYLDEFPGDVVSGTVTATLAFGVSGVTGALSAPDNLTPGINDLVTITLVDSNLNTASNAKQSVAAGSSLWGGTTTNRRGDHLTVKNYPSGGNWIDVSTPDGYQVGSTTVRISSLDNTYVWMVPTGASSSYAKYGSPIVAGSSSFSLGTESVSPIPLVRGSTSGATSFLSSASTSSFIATLDGLNNTVEISPDGTHWISIPIIETGGNSGTFVGTIGFDYTAARLTTNTSTSVTSVISDYTGTTTLSFDSTYTRLDSFIGTGSVVRIFDGATQEFTEVTSPSDTVLTVKKLSNSTAYDPDKTWVQVIGNDMSTGRLDTVSSKEVFRVGGYFGATYRVRYNDAVGNSNAYLGGDTLAITTSNMGFTTYTGELSTDVTGTTGPDTFIVVTLVDQDLNTNTTDKQTTFESNASGSDLTKNENGLGLPSGSSTGNVSRGYKNGGTGKIIYTSTLSSITSTSVNQSAGGNTIDFPLVETAVNSGTFVGSFKLSSTTATTNGTGTAATENILKVSNGDNVYVYYNDSPSATAADNSVDYKVAGPIAVETSLGSLSLSKDTAYLDGDTIVATVVDTDRNTTSAADTLTTAIKVTGSNYSVGTDLNLNLVENGVNTGTFLATFKTGTTTNTGATPQVVKAIRSGVVNVIYTDTSPSSSTVTKTLSFSEFDATMLFDAESYGLGSYATITLADAERNNVHTSAQTLLSDVFIQTSSVNSTKVRMIETGADTGTFLGSIQVASSGGTTEFTRIQAAEGEELTITYIDETNTTGSSRTVTDTAAVTAAVTPSPTPSPTATVSVTPTATPTATATATPVESPTATVSPTPPVTTGTVNGFVTDADTGDPIEGAVVRNQTGVFTGTTDVDGFYEIANVQAGDRTFTASATGYTTSAPVTVTVVAGEIAALDFALISVPVTPVPTVTPPVTATLVVAVSDTDGIAVVGATVTVDGQTATTGANGSATFSELATGDYTVTVTAEGCSTNTVDVTVTAPVTIQEIELNCACPDATEVAATTASVDQDSLTLAKGSSEDVTITVTGDDNCPAEGVKVKRKLTSANKKKIKVTPASAETDASGEATFTIKAKKNKGKANVKFAIKGVANPKVNVSLTK